MLFVATHGMLRAAGMSIGYTHPQIKVSNGKTATAAEIVYHAIRCGLYHDGLVPTDIEFTENAFRAVQENGKLGLPKRLVLGLIFAVIGSHANAGNSLNVEFVYEIGSVTLNLDYFWGKEVGVRTGNRVRLNRFKEQVIEWTPLPNPAIERTFQRPLRALWPAAHVER